MDTPQRNAQRCWDQRRVKTRLNLRVSRQVRQRLLAAAHEQQLPICELAERLLLRGLERGVAQQLEELALPQLAETVRAVLKEQTDHTEERLAKLLVRTLIASDTTRRLLYAHMAKQWGVEQIREVHESAKHATINALKERGWAAALRVEVGDGG